jgi:flagellar hook-associated protein 1 FlgK
MGVYFSPLEIGRRALRASQLGITVTSHNIANVNTPGYTRQTVSLSPTPTDGANLRLSGTGVTIEGVLSARDQFLEARLQTETTTSGRLTAERDALHPVQEIFNDTGREGGIQSALNNFFGAFRDLEASPGSQPIRSLVLDKGNVLAGAFRATRNQLSRIRSDADRSLRATVEEANSLAAKVADLNARIGQAEGSGGNAHELRDQRGEAVRRLAELTGANSFETDDGAVTLTLGDGRAVVVGNQVHKLDVVSTPPDGLAAINLDGQSAVISDGKIRGLQNAISTIGEQITDIDNLAAAVAARVNTLHTSGSDLNGNAGAAFFVAASGGAINAANIDVATAIKGDPKLVVAAANGAGSGDATIARGIAGLLSDPASTAGSRAGSFPEIYASIVRDAGAAVRNTDDALITQQAVLQQTQAQRDSVSGVSLDEEAVMLLQYQRSYEAAAKLLKIADEMTQTILSLGQ